MNHGPVTVICWLRDKYPILDTMIKRTELLEREVTSARQTLGVVLHCEDVDELRTVVGTVHRRLTLLPGETQEHEDNGE